jgi:hypothetical protein
VVTELRPVPAERFRVPHSCAFCAQEWDSTAPSPIGILPDLTARVVADAFVRPAPTRIVILREVAASRSEAAAQSKSLL